MLKLVQVDSFYGRSHVLHGVNLDVQPGEITTILGRNGTGKTTLLKTIMGLTDRATGEIRYENRDIVTQPTFRRARAGFAYVPQGREIIPDFTIRENILLGAFARADGQARSIPSLVPELFPYLMENLDRRGGMLSGGQQQQLAIARALAAEPKIILLDEPTEGIQPSIVEEIEKVIIRLNRVEHLTVILVEQNVDFARRAARRFAMMEKGQRRRGGRHRRTERRSGSPPHGGMNRVASGTRPDRCVARHPDKRRASTKENNHVARRYFQQQRHGRRRGRELQDAAPAYQGGGPRQCARRSPTWSSA